MPEKECYWIRCMRCDRVASTTHRPTFCYDCGGAVVVVPVSAAAQNRLERRPSRSPDRSSGSCPGRAAP